MLLHKKDKYQTKIMNFFPMTFNLLQSPWVIIMTLPQVISNPKKFLYADKMYSYMCLFPDVNSVITPYLINVTKSKWSFKKHDFQ